MRKAKRDIRALLKAIGRDEAATALIEAALSVPLLLLLLLGAVEFGRVAYAAIEVSNAASAAAMYASSSHVAATDTAGISTMATNDAANLTSTTGGTVSVTNVSRSCSCANTGYTPKSCADNQTCTQNGTALIQTVTVNTQVTYKPLISYIGGPTSFTLTGQAIQQVSNQ